MRLVVKIGTRSLLSPDGTPDLAMAGSLIDQIAGLRARGVRTALVSSGAVGAGRALWAAGARAHKFHDSVLEKQALAAIGQARLIDIYNNALGKHGMLAAQLLLTRHDFRHRRHCVTLGRLLERLLAEPDILPVINENDSIAVEELVFTDNDELAGFVAPQIAADRLIILSDVDGVYDTANGSAVIPRLDFEQGDSRVDTATLSGAGRGGMASKLATARRLARAGIGTHIARAREPDVLRRLLDGESLGTFVVPSRKAAPMKRWLAADATPANGRIAVNAPLAEKLRSRGDLKKGQALSLLPVGITNVLAPFAKGDVVEIADEQGRRLGHGVARYDAAELGGYCGRQQMPVFIHYNALHLDAPSEAR